MNQATASTLRSHSPNYEGSGDRNKESSFTAVMLERWQKVNSYLPLLDQRDIIEDSPVFNANKKSGPVHQHHPEFTQSSYMRLRSLEEAFRMENYFGCLDKNQNEKLTLA